MSHCCDEIFGIEASVGCAVMSVVDACIRMTTDVCGIAHLTPSSQNTDVQL